MFFSLELSEDPAAGHLLVKGQVWFDPLKLFEDTPVRQTRVRRQVSPALLKLLEDQACGAKPGQAWFAKPDLLLGKYLRTPLRSILVWEGRLSLLF